MRQRTQSAGGFVGIALDGKKALDQSPYLARQPGAGAKRGLFEEPVRDFTNRAAAHGIDARNRQEIGDECMFRVAAISAGPRSARPRGRRALSLVGLFGLSAIAGLHTRHAHSSNAVNCHGRACHRKSGIPDFRT